MKLTINGNISAYYLQTLCLLFFPGAKFSESEVVTPDVPTVTVDITEHGDFVSARATLKIGDKEVTREHSEVFSQERTAKKTVNFAASKAFFQAASTFFGYTPSWGMLTGVRPTKIALDYLKAGLTKDECVKALRDEYFLYPKKAILATDIARHERKIIKKYPSDTCSLYISIPFCPTRCSYCSFVSYTTKKLLSLIPAYLEALKTEIKYQLDLIKMYGMKLKTIYIGGGTPTTLDGEQLNDLLSFIDRHTDTSLLDEFTLEAGRPDTVDEYKLACAKSHNVTRISVNPQTLNNYVLAEVGRPHTAETFFRAYEMAHNSGIPNINTDLIIGLPTDDFVSYGETIDKIIELAPSNITAHTFCVKKSADIVHEGVKIYSRDDFDVAKCVDYTQILAKKNGYVPYYMYRQKNALGNFENVGFCKKGCEGLYNILMMEEVHTIFAAGAGAVTKFVLDDGAHIERIFNPKYPYEYLEQNREEAFLSLKERYENFFCKNN